MQSKIYLALARVEKAEVRTISKSANVARPDVYRVISQLEEMGLVEKIVDTPSKYKATPIKEGYSILLQNKTDECTQLHQKIDDLFKHTQEAKTEEAFLEEEQFVLISSKKLFQKKCLAEDLRVQKTIDAIGDDVMVAWFYINRQVFEDAIARGVQFRIVAEKKDLMSMLKIRQLFKESSAFDIRFIEPTPIKMVVYDRKKAWMCIQAPYNDALLPILLSNNPQFVMVLSTFFENIWSHAIKPAAPTKKRKPESITAKSFS